MSSSSSSSYSVKNNSSSNGRASSELKLYQALIFFGPIFFSFILLILFYFLCRKVDWSSLRTRPSSNSLDISSCELGLKKELRDMLPIVVFSESFFVRDTQCSVCLGEYLGEDRLQQIPACGHTFHMECIDLWLSAHTSCPLCRQSLLVILPRPDENTAFDSDEMSGVNNDGSLHTNEEEEEEEEDSQNNEQQQYPLECDEKS